MFGRHPESRDFVYGLALTLLVVAGFVIHASRRDPESQSRHATLEPTQLPARAQAAPPDVRPVAIATVYECHGDNGRMFGDRPCGDDAQLREVAPPNAMDAVPVARSSRSSSRDVHRGKRAELPAASPEPRANKDICARIDARIDSINARMRRAYKDAEGERYREELRQLSDRRWDANCRNWN